MEKFTRSAEVSQTLLAFASSAMSADETRYYLRGVFVDFRGFLAATNGHMLLAANIRGDRDGANPFAGWREALALDQDGVLIPSQVIKALPKPARGDKAPVVTLTLEVVIDSDGHVTGHKATLGAGAWAMAWNPADSGTFPDWARVVPSEVSGEAGTFNPELMATLAKAAKALGLNPICARLCQNGPDKPAGVVFDGLAECFGVLMPCRAPATQPETQPEAWASTRVFAA